MLVKIENKTKLRLRIVLIISIFIVIFFQFKKIFSDFDINTFYLYKDKLSFISLSFIVILGLISYLPLSLYDFVIKDTCNISLNNKDLYKSSWIASSISSIVGFGGTSAIALKSYFYSPYIKDKTALVKEVSKVVLLNFTGFSVICLIYSIINIRDLQNIDIIKLGILFASLYMPILTMYNLNSYRCESKKEFAINNIKIMILSTIEWMAMALLLFSILKMMGVSLSISKIFPIYVTSSAIGIISMMPGGIGGFDISFIIGVNSLGVNKEEALLALVLYRISYYIIPLTVGIFLFLYETKKKINKNFFEILKLGVYKIKHNKSNERYENKEI